MHGVGAGRAGCRPGAALPNRRGDDFQGRAYPTGGAPVRSGHRWRPAAWAALLSPEPAVGDAAALPTPGLQYRVHAGPFSGGVVITASHNPAEFNGIKVVDRLGMELSRPEEEKIEARYFGEDYALAGWDGVGHVREDATGIGRYLDGILSKVDAGAIREAGLRVVVDCGNGPSCGTSPALASRLGCEVV